MIAARIAKTQYQATSKDAHELLSKPNLFRQLKYFREAISFNCFGLLHLGRRGNSVR